MTIGNNSDPPSAGGWASATRLSDGSRVVTGNTYDKFRTRNPIARRLQAGFLKAADELVDRALAASTEGRTPRVLEIGCGPGDLAAELFSRRSVGYHGFDIDLGEVAAMRSTVGRSFAPSVPPPRPLSASAYQLPFVDASFDLVLTCEVLEHLERPEQALREIARVARGPVLLSVPWEPVWRLLNLLRGSYLRQLGNTPGHVQNFSRSGFRSLLSSQYEILQERRPLPWTMLLARRCDAP